MVVGSKLKSLLMKKAFANYKALHTAINTAKANSSTAIASTNRVIVFIFS